jgi:ABC-type lipoprotein release transport system permease subunit
MLIPQTPLQSDTYNDNIKLQNLVVITERRDCMLQLRNIFKIYQMGGLIPSRKAAKKDPVVALRTE